eukprot:scaffold10854_cov155-Skeletonema_dohrnii-CCMP3373.AAC.7
MYTRFFIVEFSPNILLFGFAFVAPRRQCSSTFFILLVLDKYRQRFLICNTDVVIVPVLLLIFGRGCFTDADVIIVINRIFLASASGSMPETFPKTISTGRAYGRVVLAQSLLGKHYGVEVIIDAEFRLYLPCAAPSW